MPGKQRKAPPKSQRAKRQPKNNGVRYTDKAKSVAVETVRAAGGRITDQVLADVRLVINTPTLSLSTLDSWWKNAQKKQESTEPTNESRNLVLYEFDQSTDALSMWIQTRDNYLKAANRPYQLSVVDGKEAVAAAERAQKMIQLLQGLPTEIIGIIPTLNKIVALLKELEWDAATTLEDYCQQLHAQWMARKSQSEVDQDATNG